MKSIFTLLVAIFCSLQLIAGAFLNPANGNTDTIYPPCNLEGEDIGFAVELVWQAPGTCEPDSPPVETAGFRIYRDEIMIAETDGETFSYTDDNHSGFGYLPPGTYSYTITALYMVDDDLVESEYEGPVEMFIALEPGFINGILFDCAGNGPIGGATIIYGDFSTITHENGLYSLILFMFDTIDVHISAPGYFDSAYQVVWGWPYWPLPSIIVCLWPDTLTGSNPGLITPANKILSVYPLPATEMLNISSADGIDRVRIFSLTGKMILDRPQDANSQAMIDVSRFSAGIYTLQVITRNDLILNRKIIISR
jgi:hypothetical protein